MPTRATSVDVSKTFDLQSFIFSQNSNNTLLDDSNAALDEEINRRLDVQCPKASRRKRDPALATVPH
jgi:hypothetical protein